MAVKIIRQVKKIVLLGSATSAAALRGGSERAPAALRAAGLADRLKSAGFEVSDHGDTSPQVFQPDDEHPRARNVSAILKSLNELRPRVEVAVKTGALPLILSGDSISVLAAIAGARRYYRNVSLIYMDRHAGLSQPASTSTGCIDEMVISHVIGRGAPELVRFWGEPPLVRDPDIGLFGFASLDPAAEQYLTTSPMRRHSAKEISAVGGAATARAAAEGAHAAKHEFVLLFDAETISTPEFPGADFPGEGGLGFVEVGSALRVFAAQPNMAAVILAGYNPDLDSESTVARQLVDLLVGALSGRIDTGSNEAPADAALASAATVSVSGSSVPFASEPGLSGIPANDPQTPDETNLDPA